MADELITVQVAYALPESQTLLTVRVPKESTVSEAIQRSHLLDSFPELSLATLRVGLFGQLVTLETLLEDNTRIEIYRPLLIDPKVNRQQRARAAQKRRRKM